MWTFEHTEIANAKPEAIWERWAAVSEWPSQNPLLKAAELKGSFAVGAKAVMVPKKGPKSTLTIIEATLPSSFVGRGKIPLGEMRVEHSLQPKGEQTEFTHRIVITGPFNKLFVKLIGRDMAAVLPEMMATIARQAEGNR